MFATTRTVHQLVQGGGGIGGTGLSDKKALYEMFMRYSAERGL